MEAAFFQESNTASVLVNNVTTGSDLLQFSEEQVVGECNTLIVGIKFKCGNRCKIYIR